MKTKIPTIVAVELIIAALSFLIASDKTRFGEIAFLLTLIIVIVFTLFYAFKSMRVSWNK